MQTVQLHFHCLKSGLADVHVEISFGGHFYPCDYAFTYECLSGGISGGDASGGDGGGGGASGGDDGGKMSFMATFFKDMTEWTHLW